MKSKKKLFAGFCAMAAVFTICCATSLMVNAESNSTDKKTTQTAMAPEIKIDFGVYEKNALPNGRVGTAYKLFPVMAEDVYGEKLNVSVRVYVHYYSSTKAQVSVIDGKFTPMFSSIYTVEYSAVDFDGNSTIETYDVLCVEKENLNLNLEINEYTGVAGNVVQVAPYKAENVSGVADVEISAKLKGTNISYTVEDDLTFRPLYAGEYSVNYICSDYNEKILSSYTLEIAEAEAPVLLEDLTLNEYYIKGMEYTLPVGECYYCGENGPIRLIPNISIRYGYGKLRAIENSEEFTPNQVGDAEIVYEYFYDGKLLEKRFDVQMVDVGYGDSLDITKYFYNQNGTVEANNDGVFLYTYKDGGTADFIKPVLAYGFGLNFGVMKDYAYYDSVDIILTDSKDAEISVCFSYVRNANKAAWFYVNGESRAKTSSAFGQNTTLQFNYSEAEHTATLDGSDSLYIEKDINGNPFNGFPSEKVVVSIRVNDVVGKAGVAIYQINGQALYAMEMDGNAPQAYIDSYAGGEKTVGDLITLSRIYVDDVLSMETKVQYVVYDPNMQPITDVNGVLLDGTQDYTKSYSFVPTEYGYYNILIIVTDEWDNSEMYNYTVTISDQVAPVITLLKGSEKEVRVGDKVTLLKANVSDDVTKDVLLKKYVMTPDSILVEVKNEYVVEQAGVYTVYYYATDAAGNVGMDFYTIVVK